MKKLIILALVLACAGTGAVANADCTMTSYSIVHNWAAGVCTDYKGNQYELRMSYIDWVLDYGL